MRPLGWVLLALLSWSTRSAAQTQTSTPTRAAVLTMSPGEHPFARFGHNALLLEWGGARPALVYNYGTFAFEGISGIQDFMEGRLEYWLSVETLEATLAFYSGHGRGVVAQDLALTAPERRRLARALAENALPKNRRYRYDYYLDNCSTRVRDVLDRTLSGTLTRQVSGPGRLTFREHTERMTASAPWLYTALDLALGAPTDRPTTRRQELFLPGELHDELSALQRADDHRPLVQAERVLVRAPGNPPPRDPPNRFFPFLLSGLALGACFAALGKKAPRCPPCRISLGLGLALSGLVLGLLGVTFLVFWFFTTHWAAHRNENVLLCPPWALALVVLGARMARGRPRATEQSRRVLDWTLGGALVAGALALVPGFGQDNTRIAALLLPFWVGARMGVGALFRGSRG